DYLSVEPYALALPRGDSDFRLAVDRALSHIYRSGEIVAVFQRTFGGKAEPSHAGRSFRETVNDTLRRRLASGRASAHRQPFKIMARDLGDLKPGLCLDNVAELIERVE